MILEKSISDGRVLVASDELIKGKDAEIVVEVPGEWQSVELVVAAREKRITVPMKCCGEGVVGKLYKGVLYAEDCKEHEVREGMLTLYGKCEKRKKYSVKFLEVRR